MTTMSSERAEEPMAPNQGGSLGQGGSPGRILAGQREAMGWTVEQVADQLKLAVRQVVALEAGDYAALPSPAVTRGFVRAYAKLVRIDPAPLVAQIAIESPGEPEVNTATARRPTPASFSQAKFPSHGKRSSLPLGWIAAVIVVAAAAGAAWHFGLIPLKQHGEAASVATPAASTAPAGASSEAANGSSSETLQNPSVPLISVPGPADAPAPGAASAGAVVNVPASTATGAPPTAGSAAQLGAAPASPVTAQSPAQAGAPAAANTPAATAPTTGANALVLSVREDAWIEVRPAKGGTPMIKRLVKAGSTETVNVDQPVRVIVGNPGSVSASLRGAPVALPMVPGKTYSLVNLQ
jgi:cytoskeleton protein RodZ